LTAARERREEKAVAKLADANPLYAEQIREEHITPDRKKRAR